MHDQYPVGSLKFEKAISLQERTAFTRENVGWANVLRGKALGRFLGRYTPKKLPRRDRAEPIRK